MDTSKTGTSENAQRLASSSEFPSVSIVINTMNRADFLPKTLKSLQYLDYPHFEVIVVVGPCHDNTDSVLEEFKSDIRLAYCPEANLSRSRNIGIREARGEIVVFIDDDGIPIPEWLNRIVPAYKDPEVAAVGGWVYNHTGAEYQAQYLVHSRDGSAKKSDVDLGYAEMCYPHTETFPGLVGVNSSFRRASLYQISGFDEWFRYFLDETDVILRLVDRGYRVVCVPNAIVHHKGAPSNMRSYYLTSRSELYFAIQNKLPWKTFAEVHQAVSEIAQKNIEAAIALDKLHGTPGMREAGTRRDIERGLSEAADFCAHMPYRLFGLRSEKPTQGEIKKYARMGNEDRLRICMVSQEYPPRVNGGIAIETKEQAQGLAARGHLVNVITKSHDGLHSVEWEDGVWVHRLPITDPTPVTCSNGATPPLMISALANAMLAGVQKVSALHTLDAVSAHIWDCEGLGVLTKTNLPLITHLETTYLTCRDHQPAWNANPQFMREHVDPTIACERFILKNCTRLHAISRAILGEVEHGYGVADAQSRAHLVPIGISDRNPGAWKPMPERGHVEGLFVGRLEKRKGIDTLFECLPVIMRENPRLQMTIAGDYSITNETGRTYRDQFLAQHGTQPWIDRVVFRGKISDADLDKAYRSCDFFVGPSRFESFGIVFVEAMMFGKPVIACNAGGVPEVVEHDVTGLLTTPGDAQGLLNALRTMSTSADLRNRMGRAGRERYDRLFHRDRMVDGMEKLYFEVRKERFDAANPSPKSVVVPPVSGQPHQSFQPSVPPGPKPHQVGNPAVRHGSIKPMAWSCSRP